MDVGADFPADTQPAKPAQKCEARFDDPAVLAQVASVLDAAPGDEWADAQFTDLAVVDVVVVTAVGVGDVGALTGSSALAADGRYGGDQGQKVGDVVVVATGHGGGQGYAMGVGNDVVLAARLAPVGEGPVTSPPFSGPQGEPSTEARLRSKASPARSSANRSTVALLDRRTCRDVRPRHSTRGGP